MTIRILTAAEHRLAMTEDERAEQRNRWGRVHIAGDNAAKVNIRDRKGR